MYTMIDGEPVDLGVAFGYCFLPEVFGNSSVMSFSPAGDNETWQGHPYCESQEDAVLWLTERGIAGQVMRFAHHEAPEDRGVEYRVWVTSGVVAKVEGITLEEKCPKYAKAVEWSKAYGKRLRAI